ncbi:TPM domain-containing protein [Brevibacillus laterosporus]|uniref:TPM domain-containing protein n=1 Tax=Brevibacillus halotolerans TaxID=1507437 RepID=A0ABT4I156_9BACL|nr:septation ring formation regulator EzrA [Brevibacillus laterosporus]MCR8986725.1 TPM domain-containing protein [Brevibacillus laterosporus]MCZ0832461.1 TPM domain-containing protein [Brevibacillus halotolerans]
MKKRLLLLCLAGTLCFHNVAMASPFPKKTSDIVQDQAKIFKKDERKNLEESLKQTPGNYKVVVVESTEPEAKSPDEYAQKLYAEYKLEEDSLLMVLDKQKKDLGVYAGPKLVQQGAKSELLKGKLTAYFDPWKNTDKFDQGISQFAKEVQSELSKLPKPAETAAATDADPNIESQENTLLNWLPWWVFVLAGALFVGLIYLMILTMRRRTLMRDIDELEDWKDELLEKIEKIEVEKNKRRVSGMTEERYVALAARKEKLLGTSIPDIEMLIIEADEACDRFRFKVANNLILEGETMLNDIEDELEDLKNDTTQVVQAKNENKQAIPELEKMLEQVERKLSDVRLEYGLSFHELKTDLDRVGDMKATIKSAIASGDNVKAAEVAFEAHSILRETSDLLEQLPTYVNQVRTEMKEELHQLEQDIETALGGQYDLNQTALDEELLQVKQLVTSAGNALEEGNFHMLQTHVKAFVLKVESIYSNLEQAVLGEKGEELTDQAQPVESSSTLMHEDTYKELADDHQEVTAENTREGIHENAERSNEEPREETDHPATQPSDTVDTTVAYREAAVSETMTEDTPAAKQSAPSSQSDLQKSRSLISSRKQGRADGEEQHEYELVMPKIPKPMSQESEKLVKIEERPFIETEDDILDEMERISGELICIRQRIKRSYLPGVPDDLKTKFDTVVGLLGQIQLRMENTRYDIREVAYYLEEAHEQLMDTHYMAENTIAACQSAEGAIQYTNRYRRLNRQVNELLTKSEQAFRQLYFTEAYQLAEEARLIIEGDHDDDAGGRWMLRKKKRGER